jgi:hypothetical protein
VLGTGAVGLTAIPPAAAAGGCTAVYTTTAGAGAGYPPLQGYASVESGGWCSYFSGGGSLTVECTGPCQTNTGYYCYLPNGCGPQFAGFAYSGEHIELDMLGTGQGTISDSSALSLP